MMTRTEILRRSYLKHLKKRREAGRRYYYANLDRQKELRRKRYDRVKSRVYVQARQKSDPDKHRQRIRAYTLKYADKKRAYNQKNADRIRNQKRKYYIQNRDKILERIKCYEKTNLRKRLKSRLSSRIRNAINRNPKSSRTIALLGCSIKDFIIYLESRFDVGMTWSNYGREWHIDHIMPCAIFDLSKPDHQRRCFHFSNLQPLWAEDNMKKADKITTNQYNLL
jgi:hypothetical protein